MRIVSVKTAVPYAVRIGPKLLPEIGNALGSLHTACETVAIITDETVAKLYLQTVEESLRKAGFSVVVFAFPPGESSKNWAVLGEILSFLAENGLTRSDLLLALGGGVVGDIAGFAAAVFQRGISWVQVPTTFLAAIDSSVGGKTAVDLPEGKNLAGAFHQPALVLCDTDTFATLPPEVFADGAAEAVKYGVLDGETLFAETAEGLSALASEDLAAHVARCVAVKARIVEQDEKDLGLRNLLNLGHTFGHAVEKESGFSLSHGKAVAIGLSMMARAMEKQRLLPASERQKIEKALEKNHLPTECAYSSEAIFNAALRDKKRRGGKLTLVAPYGIGDCRLLPIDAADALDWIRMGRRDLP